MERSITKKLIDWKSSSRRKPLLVAGARQVGKTHSVNAFGQSHYDNVAYFNFEATPQLRKAFEGELNPPELIENLTIVGNVSIVPHKTLIFFDEIQLCPNALTSLKYFNETHNEYHIIAAGSLLGVALSQSMSFPVGKVNILNLYPLSFHEFLLAVGEDKLAQLLFQQELKVSYSALIHEKSVELFKKYLYVGGMPEAVKYYSATRQLNEIRTIQQEIVYANERDFSKYASGAEAVRVAQIWHSMVAQLGRENKKFIFSVINDSARAREYERAILWLLNAGLVHKVAAVKKPGLPLATYANTSRFKLYLGDVGLLGALAELPASILLEGDTLFNHFKGMLTENAVLQSLVAEGAGDLYYWTSGRTAEIDFVFQAGETTQALECKSGRQVSSRSYTQYKEKYPTSPITKTSLNNLSFDDAGNIANYPLYLVGRSVSG